MNKIRWASDLLIISALIYGVVPPIVDLTETHVFHPDWTPHARFHMVWLLAVNSSLALFVGYLTIWPSAQRLQRLKVASVLGLIALGGFVVAAVSRGAYGGGFTDPVGGVPPIMGMDANLLVFSPAIAVQVIATALVFLADRRVS
jgi:hypothetical protein